jgi:ubiquitin C-terminal hydrolase
MDKTKALEAFARMVNTSNANEFLQLIHEDFIYSSQSVLEDITSKVEFSSYIKEKLNSVSLSSNKIYAEMSEMQPYPMSTLFGPCVVLAQGNKDNLVSTVLANVSNNMITRISLCIIPPPETTLRSGIYPT